MKKSLIIVIAIILIAVIGFVVYLKTVGIKAKDTTPQAKVAIEMNTESEEEIIQ